MTNPLAILGYSHEQALLVYRDQVVRLAERVKLARIATENGKGGRDGKRYEGKFMHQIEAQFIAAVNTLYEIEKGDTAKSIQDAMKKAERTIAEVVA